MPWERLFTVDRVHEREATLLDEHARALTLPLTELPERLQENTVLRVPVSEWGQPEWQAARIDVDETERRRNESAQIAEKLRHSGPHGFIDEE